MSNTSEPHDHHFTPQGFLKQWCNQDGFIWRSRKIKFNDKFETRKQPSTASIAWKEDLYNITDQYRNSRIISFAIEYMKHRYGVLEDVGFNFEITVFDKVDNDGIQACRLLVEGVPLEQLSRDHRYNLFRFTYLLQARNPVFLKNMTSTWLEEIRPQFENEFKGLKDFSLDDLSSDGNSGKLALLDIALDFKIVDELYMGIEYFILNIEDYPLYFITSDYPYVAMPDIGSKTALHFLPLSPKQCLIMSKNHALLQQTKTRFLRYETLPATVEVINFVLAACSGEVYSWFGQTPLDLEVSLGLYSKNPDKARMLLTSKLQAT